jgi:tRNA (cmo5U34)-methyltransferase
MLAPLQSRAVGWETTTSPVTQYHFDPDTYLGMIRADVAAYDEFQDAVVDATRALSARAVLELGIGTGETARRILAAHPDAQLVGIDESESMLAVARRELDVDARASRLEDPLPEGPFDLVVSALAVHHLDGKGKRDLFARVHALLRPGGLFVLGDVVVPERPEDATIPLSPDFDLPDRLDDVVRWLREAGFATETVWERADLAVVGAKRPAS